MTLQELTNAFIIVGDAERKTAMENYMKNKFSYFGIPKPIRSTTQKNFLQPLKKEKGINWDLVFSLWNRNEREFQYVALDYLITKKKLLTLADLPNLKKIITSKSWWDTVDLAASHLVGFLFLHFPKTKNEIAQWSTADNMWLKRTAIIAQLKCKENTDTTFLESAIVANLGSDEFFINKAIGWALREYSKTNSPWVRQFINKYQLQPLSVKEASKHLK